MNEITTQRRQATIDILTGNTYFFLVVLCGVRSFKAQNAFPLFMTELMCFVFSKSKMLQKAFALLL